MEDIDKLKKTIKSFWTTALPELNRLAVGDVDSEIIETVLEELVEVAVTGHDECAIQSWDIVAVKYRDLAERRKPDIIRWIFEYTDKCDEESWKYFLGFNFVLKLNWDDLYVQYIKKYDKFLRIEFDDDYIAFYGLEKYVEQDQ